MKMTDIDLFYTKKTFKILHKNIYRYLYFLLHPTVHYLSGLMVTPE